MTIESEHFDPTYEISLEVVKKRAIKGIAVLTGRTLILNVISFVAQGLLWLFIEPGEYGVFLLVSATINFLSYFADIGLGASLIQKKENPQKDDYSTVFLVQEGLVLMIVFIVLLLSPFLAKTYSYTPEALHLLYALDAAFFLASLKNIPSIILERKLEYNKFVIPQVLENLVYSISIVFFAWRGYGISTFTYSVLIRGIVGVVVMYILQPWKPIFKFSMSSFKGLLKFGIPYQVNNFLATIKDDGMTIVLGGILGSFGIGILGTAQKLAMYPLRFFMDNVTKVTFPAFSRMQDDKDQLGKALERSIFFISALVFPSLIGLVVLFPDLISVIPKYQKWSPAYYPLVFLTINSLWAAATTQLTNLLASIGNIKINVKLMVIWTSLTWILVPSFSKLWGVVGASIAYAIVGSSSIIVFMISKKYVNWSITNAVLKPFIASTIMGGMIMLEKEIVSIGLSIPRFALSILFGSVVYFGLMYFFFGNSLISDTKKVLVQFTSQK
jgi:O-antigen/teichoic acid export membrane protein